jgi:hypothetical protein
MWSYRTSAASGDIYFFGRAALRVKYLLLQCSRLVPALATLRVKCVLLQSSCLVSALTALRAKCLLLQHSYEVSAPSAFVFSVCSCSVRV